MKSIFNSSIARENMEKLETQLVKVTHVTRATWAAPLVEVLGWSAGGRGPRVTRLVLVPQGADPHGRLRG